MSKTRAGNESMKEVTSQQELDAAMVLLGEHPVLRHLQLISSLRASDDGDSRGYDARIFFQSENRITLQVPFGLLGSASLADRSLKLLSRSLFVLSRLSLVLVQLSIVVSQLHPHVILTPSDFTLHVGAFNVQQGLN